MAVISMPLPSISSKMSGLSFPILNFNQADMANIIVQFPPCPIFNKPFQDGVQLRVMFAPQTLPRLLFPYINDRKDMYGRDVTIGLHDPSLPNLGPKKVVVDFSSPSIEEFKGKHL